MAHGEHIEELEASAARFTACIESLPEALFLERMDEAWAPRDVLAHLIGWNRYTMEGSELIMRGELPPYFADAGDDFAEVNAASVRRYASRDRGELLTELEASLQELKEFLRSLAPEGWEAAVLYGEHRITVENSVQALIDDYRDHREQIERWAEGRRAAGSHGPAE